MSTLAAKSPTRPPPVPPWMLTLFLVSNAGRGSQILPWGPQISCQAVLNHSVDLIQRS